MCRENHHLTICQPEKTGLGSIATLYPGTSIERKSKRGKSKFYELEGWDPRTGWQKKDTLLKLGLNQVADELQNAQKL